MRLILNYIKRYKLLFLLNVISVFGFALVELGIPTIIANMIDKGIAYNQTTYLYQQGLLMAVISIIGVCGTILLGYCCAKISTNITYDIRLDLFKKIQTFSHEEFKDFKISSLITRTNNDAFQIQMFVNVLLRTALLTPVMLIISLFLTYQSSVELFYVILGTIPFIILGVVLIAKFSGPLSEKQQASIDNVNQLARENLTGVRVIRAFNQQQIEKNKFNKVSEDFKNYTNKLFKLMSSSAPIFFLLMNIASCIIFYLGGILIDADMLQVGKLVAFMDYLFHAMLSMMLFCTVFMMYPRANVSAKRIQEVLNRELKLVNAPTSEIPSEGEGMKFTHVSYTSDQKKILDDINFEAKVGETIAIVGSTGSGKSSLARLIPRFFDCSEGSITYNGINIKDFDVNDWRKKIGFISQKAMLFSGTIKENICYGKKDATDEEVIHAAKVAQAYDFIMEKELKFDEMISENATNVSGGQKQRLSIARAIVRKPAIYVFDDAFSALDFKTDATLRKALFKETSNSIVFIVATRISTIMNADKIIVLNHGKMEAIGTHGSLLKDCPLYQEIVESQMGKEELDYE